jgi:formate-dependent nitrite reductase cytochrome c552 subunit
MSYSPKNPLLPKALQHAKLAHQELDPVLHEIYQAQIALELVIEDLRVARNNAAEAARVIFAFAIEDVKAARTRVANALGRAQRGRTS